jgi:hypothetical protein
VGEGGTRKETEGRTTRFARGVKKVEGTKYVKTFEDSIQ